MLYHSFTRQSHLVRGLPIENVEVDERETFVNGWLSTSEGLLVLLFIVEGHEGTEGVCILGSEVLNARVAEDVAEGDAREASVVAARRVEGLVLEALPVLGVRALHLTDRVRRRVFGRELADRRRGVAQQNFRDAKRRVGNRAEIVAALRARKGVSGGSEKKEPRLLTSSAATTLPLARPESM